MFKERLIETGANILKVISAFVFFGFWVWVLITMPEWLKTVIGWVCTAVIGLIVLFLLVMWVHWQFIEPYRDWKRRNAA